MRILLPFLILATLLGGCISVETQTPPSPHFVTATLPALPAATSTPTAPPADAAPTLPRPADCNDKAVLLQDVTIPDGTRVEGGKPFTKTWRLRNMGTCPWDAHYTLAFLAGQRMDAPDSVPVPVTAPKADADISVELTAPAANGSYTGLFELRDPSGRPIAIGLEKSIWVKINVGAGAPAPQPTSAATVASGGVKPIQTAATCQSSENSGYVNQLVDLINAARREAKLHALSVNPQLTAAAQAHSRDMACNNFLNHNGSDGSWINDRLLAAGYSPSYYLEIIAIGTPQDAMNQWRNDAPHWEAVLDPKVTEIGVGYVYNPNSDYGGYFTVDLGSQ